MSDPTMLDTNAAPIVHDPEFPAAPELLGEGGRELVTSLLAGQGGELQQLQNDFALYTPGRGITVTYGTQVSWRNGSLTQETVVAHARRDRAPGDGVTSAELAGAEVGLWRFPADPYLPGLAHAADPQFVAKLLDDLGFPSGKVTLRLRAYRPGVRAVVQATISRPTLYYYPDRRRFEEGTLRDLAYLKVLRPGQAGPLAAAHDTFAEVLPAPRCLARDDELAIVVLEAMPGRTLGSWITREPPGPGPRAEELLELLDRIVEVPFQGSPVGTIADQVRSHVHLLRALAPEETERIERIGAELESGDPQPQITVHGDFYDSQVLVREGHVAGLLDLDDVGPGERVDDLATMAGRVWTIAQTQAEAGNRARITAYALELLDAFSSVVDPDELDRRVGGILLGRATGPFRAQEPGWRDECVRRIRTAEAWFRRPRVPGVGV